MADDDAQAELIPYASHVAHGTGRTPIGIILFAAGHLLLGSVLGYLLARNYRDLTTGPLWALLLALALGVTSLCMLLGGLALLLKGRAAWVLAVTCFALLVVGESAVAAVTSWMVSYFYLRGEGKGVMIGGVMLGGTIGVFPLCAVVLGYLAAPKARDTFALPPGETPALLRTLPKVAIALFLCAILFGVTVARAR